MSNADPTSQFWGSKRVGSSHRLTLAHLAVPSQLLQAGGLDALGDLLRGQFPLHWEEPDPPGVGHTASVRSGGDGGGGAEWRECAMAAHQKPYAAPQKISCGSSGRFFLKPWG